MSDYDKSLYLLVPMLNQTYNLFRQRFGILSASFVVAASAVVILQDPARAEFTLCNKTDSQVITAVGFKEKGKWVSSGWWTLDPEECKVAIGGDLKNKYYYVHGHTVERNIVWEESHTFCVKYGQVFNSIPNSNCSDGSEKFFQVDTGESRSFTQNLTLKSEEPSFPLGDDELPEGNIVSLCNPSSENTVTASISLAGNNNSRSIPPKNCRIVSFQRATGRARISASSSNGSRWNSSIPVKSRRNYAEYTTFQFR